MISQQRSCSYQILLYSLTEVNWRYRSFHLSTVFTTYSLHWHSWWQSTSKNDDKRPLWKKALVKINKGMQVKTTEIFNLCCMPWVKNLPHVHLKIHDSFNYWATLKKCHGFIYSTFLHMLKRNQVTWWKNDFEISPQSQDFCKQYALGENSHRGKKKVQNKSHE